MSYLTSFHLFPQLPLELRLQIWEEAIPSPRILHIKETAPSSDPGSYDHQRRNWTTTAQVPPPSMLLVNHESFDVASKYYELAFPTKKDVQYPQQGCSRTWIDFQRDVVYIDRQSFKQRYLRNPRSCQRPLATSGLLDRGRIVNLAFKGDDFLGRGARQDNHIVVHDIYREFPALKQLYIVIDHYVSTRYDEHYFKAVTRDLVFLDIPGWEHINASKVLNLYDDASPSCHIFSPRTVDFTRMIVDENQLKQRHFISDLYSSGFESLPPISYKVMCSAKLVSVLGRLKREVENRFEKQMKWFTEVRAESTES
jgi:hypothetical protein